MAAAEGPFGAVTRGDRASGGSFISGSQAQGVTSGGSGNCTSGGGTIYFRPVDPILDAYGLTPATSCPPPPSGCPLPGRRQEAGTQVSDPGDIKYSPNFYSRAIRATLLPVASVRTDRSTGNRDPTVIRSPLTPSL